ncbi:MAG: Xylose isomerase [uncultured Pyrinomonadaceae bacterium]|uniref:Xylose isomerase n=1 Tax=uncultured Pyrinomonadaceae bacterium TaxID=2283094 RepID=A0A6J4NDL8_9BACT|nr:MAG: Xylose isomerase [uncultured Pyrinomonadaceae bacterium]
MSSDRYAPRPEDKFTFGLWTVGNRGADPFGAQVREKLQPTEIVRMLAEVGAYGVNFHDNDLVPIDATASERGSIVSDFKKACDDNNIKVPMATVNLFYEPIFRDGAFTANDARVRAYAIQKTMRAMDLAKEFDAEIFVLWGGREGAETDGCRRPDEGIKRLREALNYLCEYNIKCNYNYKFAMEAKPNEPRADIYMATTAAYLAFIETLDHKEMVGVNPEVAHEQMSGLNMTHAVAQAWEAGKLFHIDLNDQYPGRYDQDLRFASVSPRQMFWLVKFLEDVGYSGMRHFDAHAYRTEDYGGVKDFARGCMRSYLILKDKAKRFNEHKEIQQILAEIEAMNDNFHLGDFDNLLAQNFDRNEIASKGLKYERLDQLTMDVLFGVD